MQTDKVGHWNLANRDSQLIEMMQKVASCLKEGDMESALASLSNLLDRYSTAPWAHLFASVVFEALNRLDEAMGEAGIALALDPKSPAAYGRMARLLRRKGLGAVADTILEAGWEQVKTLYPLWRRAAQRREFLGRALGESSPSEAIEVIRRDLSKFFGSNSS